METRFENIPIFTYLTYYLYLEFSDRTVTICAAEIEITNPLTQESFDEIANHYKRFYESQGKIVAAAKFVSKQDYEKFQTAINNGGNIIISWNEKGMRIEQKI